MRAMDARELSETYEQAIAMAREAGRLTLGYFRSPTLSVRTKGDGSPVSEADAKAERLLRERLAEHFPDDGILGEEEGETAGRSGRTWILDPIDGTVSFVHGVPLYGTLLALEVDDDVVLGVASLPAIGETVAGAKGLGARWYVGDAAPVAARVSAVERLEDALVCTTSPRGMHGIGLGEAYRRIADRAANERGWSDLFGHVLVATGRADVMFDPEMSVWDNAALLPIVEEAGGTFTDLGGVRTHRGGNALSTNGRLLDAVVSELGTGA
jgi:histidinol phosphatase-like enzyme (inositol monophosphatase family)